MPFHSWIAFVLCTLLSAFSICSFSGGPHYLGVAASKGIRTRWDLGRVEAELRQLHMSPLGADLARCRKQESGEEGRACGRRA